MMVRQIIRVIAACVAVGAFATASFGQKLVASEGYVAFFSDATIEDIKAENTASTSIFNVETGDIAFSIPIAEFVFDKSLMRQHFNEKYMETEKFPRSTFSGRISGYSREAKGPQPATAKGKLTIHGVTREIEVPGTLDFQGDAVIAKSKFMVKLADYKVKIPQLLWQNIAEEVEVTIDFKFKPKN